MRLEQANSKREEIRVKLIVRQDDLTLQAEVIAALKKQVDELLFEASCCGRFHRRIVHHRHKYLNIATI